VSVIDLERTHLAGLAGYEGLATAVLYRAAKDLAVGNGYSRDARRFLRSAGCEELLIGLLDALALQDPDPGIDMSEQAREMLGGLLARYAGES